MCRPIVPCRPRAVFLHCSVTGTIHGHFTKVYAFFRFQHLNISLSPSFQSFQHLPQTVDLFCKGADPRCPSKDPRQLKESFERLFTSHRVVIGDVVGVVSIYLCLMITMTMRMTRKRMMRTITITRVNKVEDDDEDEKEDDGVLKT